MVKHEDLIQQTPEVKNLSQYYGREAWCCPMSPTGAHHWFISGGDWGQCKHCRERRQFVESAVAGYGELGASDWGQGLIQEEALIDLSPIS